jgi:hypothetical protein
VGRADRGALPAKARSRDGSDVKGRDYQAKFAPLAAPWPSSVAAAHKQAIVDTARISKR